LTAYIVCHREKKPVALKAAATGLQLEARIGGTGTLLVMITRLTRSGSLEEISSAERAINREIKTIVSGA